MNSTMKEVEFVGHVNFVYHQSKLVPAEISFAIINHPDELYIIAVDLGREDFNSKDCFLNDILSREGHRIRWPFWPPHRRLVHTSLDNLQTYVKGAYEYFLSGTWGNFVGAIGKEQAEFFDSFCELPTVDLTKEMSVPTLELLISTIETRPPTHKKWKLHGNFHRDGDLRFCSSTIAWYCAQYLASGKALLNNAQCSQAHIEKESCKDSLEVQCMEKRLRSLSI